MSNSIEGRLIHIGQVQTFGNKGFKKREIVIETPGKYPQSIKLDLTGENCELSDPYSIGDTIKALYELRGKEWVKDGKKNWFNSVHCWRIEGEPSKLPTQQPPAKKVPADEIDDLPF